MDNDILSLPPSCLSNIHVSSNFCTANVLKLLNKLDPRSADGPDELPTILLENTITWRRHLPFFLMFVFKLLYTNVLANCILTPIFKKGRPFSPSWYQPIFLTSITCK